MNYKTLLKREESIAENCRCTTYRLLKMALKELYYNLSVFVTLWLNYYKISIARKGLVWQGEGII